MRFADRLTTFFFLATIFSVSFQNVYWDVAGRVNLADIVALLFLVAFVAGASATATVSCRRRFSPCSASALRS